MDKNIKFWNSISGSYDKQVKKVFSEAYEKTIRYTKKYLKKTDRILDIGCGTGITTIQLADDVKEIHAVDLAERMLDTARRKAISF